MLRAKTFQINDNIKCRNPAVASKDCFFQGVNYKVVRADKNVIVVHCEAECKHSIHVDDIKHYFYVPIVLERNIPQWF